MHSQSIAIDMFSSHRSTNFPAQSSPTPPFLNANEHVISGERVTPKMSSAGPIFTLSSDSFQLVC